MNETEMNELLKDSSECWSAKFEFTKGSIPKALIQKIYGEFSDDVYDSLQEKSDSSAEKTFIFEMRCINGRCWDAGARQWYNCHSLCNEFGTCYGPLRGHC